MPAPIIRVKRSIFSVIRIPHLRILLPIFQRLRPSLAHERCARSGFR